jgi:hypothetical protein
MAADPSEKTAFFQELEKAAKQDKSTAVKKLLDKKGRLSSEQINIFANWAKKAYVRDLNHPTYGLWYAQTLKTMSEGLKKHGKQDVSEELMKTASVMFISSELIARENISRCADKTAGQNYLMNWITPKPPYRKELLNHFKGLDAASQKKGFGIIMMFAEKRKTNEKDYLSCNDGMEAIKKSMDGGKCVGKPHPTVNGVTPKGMNYICDGRDYVRFIDDAEWQQKRVAIRKNMVSFLKESL